MAYQFGQRSINDLQKIVRATERLAGSVGGQGRANGMGRIASLVRDEARRLCPRGAPRPGEQEHVHLADTIGARLYQHDQAQTVYGVGTDDPRGPMVEYGTRPHVILPRDKQALWWPGAPHPVRMVNHPGTKPHPFLAPAAANTQGQWLSLLSAAIGEGAAQGGAVQAGAAIRETFAASMAATGRPA